MKRLALLLCAILIMGVVGTAAFAKKEGNGSNGKSYGKGGRYGGKPEWAGNDDEETEETGEEETEEEETEEEESNGKALGKDKDTPKAPADFNGLKESGNSRHLYLYEKIPEGDWPTLDDGAWGKMTYRPSGKTLRFVFTGHGLERGVDYTLIYYPDPWPGAGLVCLGSAMANQGGQVHISDRVDSGDIPMDGDAKEEGGKIWLVLSDDVECGTGMVGWNPTEYLFEYDVITFDDTDDDEETEAAEETEETEGE